MLVEQKKNILHQKIKPSKSKKFLSIILAGFILCSLIFNYLTYNQYQFLSKLLKDKETTALSENFGEIYRELIKKRPVYIELPNTTKIRAIVENYSNPDSIWALVSKTNSISIDYEPSDLIIPDVLTRTDKSTQERSVRGIIKESVEAMFLAAKQDGYELMIGSGYRPASLQSVYFYSLANSIGEEAANQTIARPGQSEHQTGLAIDVSTKNYECYLDNCFAYTSGGEWLAKNSYKFGFILRYPEGKEDITGYSYESWHFRFVGIDLATAIFESGLTLDETWPYLEQAMNTLKKNRAIE